MDKLSELKEILAKPLNWHKSRIDCLAQLLIAIITVRTVNLRELSIAMSGKSLSSSREKRLYRFFSKFEIDISKIGCWLITLFVGPTSKFYIAIDRTNWFWGKSPINIFMASICYEGIAIPFFWKVLPKDGSTSGKEQIELTSQVIGLLEKERIEGLLADREFANKTYISWLNRSEIAFYIRIKEDSQVYINKKKFKKAGELFPELKRYSPKVFGMRVTIFDETLYVVASKNERDELMIVVTNGNYKSAIPIYLRRWEIECLFQALKGRGFRFEETHMTHPKRIEKMMAVLAIAFAWAHRVGEWYAVKKPIKLKILKTILATQQRPSYSFFRYGLDTIRDAVTGLTVNWKWLKKAFKFLELPSMEGKI